MSSFVPLIVCLGAAIVLARSGRVPSWLVPVLNGWVMNIALPAIIFELVPTIRLEARLWFLPVSQWTLFLLTWLAFALIGERLRWSRGRIGAVVLVCGLSNTSFLGYPMLSTLRGPEALALGVVADQVGAFFALAVGGVLVASIHSGRKVDARAIAARVVTFPPFLAVVLALLIGATTTIPSAIVEALHVLGRTLSPVALFSVGLQLRLRVPRQDRIAVGLGLLSKLLLGPAVLLLLGLCAGVDRVVLDVSILQLAMAPMISAAILAQRYELDVELTNATLGLGILMSLVTVPLWALALSAS